MPLAKYKTETLLTGKSFAEYYVVFSRSELNLPWIAREFSHCYAIRWTLAGWLVFSPTLGYADVYPLESTHPDIRIALADVRYTAIIKVGAWRKIKRWRTPWPVAFTCVEQIKALLGISAWWIITPWQLYKHLGGHREPI